MKKALPKIIETVLQIIIVVLCIVGDWSDRYYGSYGIEFRKQNFLDTATLGSIDYLATIVVAVCALAIIILIWIKIEEIAILPIFLQLGLMLKTMIEYWRLGADNEGHLKALAYLHMGFVVAALVFVVLIFINSGEKNANTKE